jgi:ATP-dependent DNA helicase RecQ
VESITIAGGQTQAERRDAFRRIVDGSAKLVISNPETLQTRSVCGVLRALKVSHMVIDEAHCVTEWGESFRPAYTGLGALIEDLRPDVVTAFTATASPAILTRMKRLLFGSDPVEQVVANPDRASISYSVLYPRSKLRAVRLLAGTALSSEKKRAGGPPRLHTPMLIFCRSRNRVESLARHLATDLGWDRVGAYHAGLEPEERASVEQWFLCARDAVLVATCAYGLGIDKQDIRTTIHFDLPPSIEAFLQESGRAARDRGRGESIVLYDGTDAVASDPVARNRQALVVDYCRTRSCRRRFLIEAMGAECEACFGCDVCLCERGESHPAPIDDTATDSRSAETALLKWTRRNRRRYTIEQASRKLAGSTGNDDMSGALTGWWRSEIEELLQSLLRTGGICAPRRGPWRFRLTRNRSEAIVDPWIARSFSPPTASLQRTRMRSE